MSQDVEFSWIAAVRQEGRRHLEKDARGTLREFFKHVPDSLGCIRLKVYRISGGVDSQTLVKVVPHHPDVGPEPEGIRVKVRTQGGQGIICLMSVDGQESQGLRTLVESGPYNIRGCRIASNESTENAAGETGELINGVALDAVTGVNLEAANNHSLPEDAPIMSIVVDSGSSAPSVTELVARLSEKDLAIFKVTLATIICRAMRASEEKEIPNTLRVPKTLISEVFKEQLLIEGDSRSDFRGMIANFYRHRFACFAVKCDDPGTPAYQSKDWLLDAFLARDFVGGNEALVRLAYDHETAVAVCRTKPVQETVSNESGAGIDLAIQMLISQKGLIEQRDQAQLEEARCREAVSSLERKLADAQIELAQAITRVRQAEQALSNQQLSAEDVSRLREAQRLLNALVPTLSS